MKLLATLFATLALATACGDDDDSTGPQGEARIRIVHVAPELAEIDLLLDGNTIEEDIPYGTATAYEDVGAGDRNVEVRPTGTATAVITGSVPLTDGADHTLLVGGPGSDLQVDVLEDDLETPDGGFAKLRLIHAAPNAGAVDVYVTSPGADLALETPILSGAEFGDVLDYSEVEEGEYEIRVTAAGGLVPVIDETVSLGSGDIRTAIAVEAPGGGAPYAGLVIDDTN
jgi:hypothetical protein